MAQQGYTSCSGCGRMFRLDSDTEMELLATHDCQEDEDEDEDE